MTDKQANESSFKPTSLSTTCQNPETRFSTHIISQALNGWMSAWLRERGCSSGKDKLSDVDRVDQCLCMDSVWHHAHSTERSHATCNCLSTMTTADRIYTLITAVSASSQRAGVMLTRASTCSSAYVYNGCLTWYNVLLIPRITQA